MRGIETTNLLVLVSIVFLLSGALGSLQEPMQVRFSNFDKLQDRLTPAKTADRSFGAVIGQSYKTLFSGDQHPGRVATLQNADLVTLFRAAVIAEFYTSDSRYTRDMQLDMAELQRRGIARNWEFADMYSAFMHSRLFLEAKRLALGHPSVGSAKLIPQLRDVSGDGKNGPTELVLNDSGTEALRRDVGFNPEGQIIVASAPLCGACQRALLDIESDARLRGVFSKRAIFIVPPDASDNFQDVLRWNHDHPDERMTLVYNVNEWPMIDRWDTPVFYFFKRGRLVRQIIGWAPWGSKKQLWAALHLFENS